MLAMFALPLDALPRAQMSFCLEWERFTFDNKALKCIVVSYFNKNLN